MSVPGVDMPVDAPKPLDEHVVEADVELDYKAYESDKSSSARCGAGANGAARTCEVRQDVDQQVQRHRARTRSTPMPNGGPRQAREDRLSVTDA